MVTSSFMWKTIRPSQGHTMQTLQVSRISRQCALYMYISTHWFRFGSVVCLEMGPGTDDLPSIALLYATQGE